MRKITDIDVLTPLIILGFVFSLLYFPLMNRGFNFEELKVTSAYFESPPSTASIFSRDTQTASLLEEFWRDYLRIHPPGIMLFYSAWRLISQENEIVMRLPLLFLIILSLIKLFHFFRKESELHEASVMTLLFGLLPFWLGVTSRIFPESFALLFALLSTLTFLEDIKEQRVSKSLISFNLLGLLSSYFFSFIVVLQAVFFLSFHWRKKALVHALCFLLVTTASLSSCYYFNQSRYSNPLTFYWEKSEKSEFVKLIELMHLGRVRSE